MIKYRILAFFLQFILAPSSKATYILQKLPTNPKKLINHYKVVYELKNHKEKLKEEGILTEIITLFNPICHDDPKYILSYKYQQYKEKSTNDFLIDCFNGNEFESKISLDSSFNILECDNYHPIVFYLYNIRSGLNTEFSHKGTSWFASLPDNKSTYLSNPTYSYLLHMHIQYTVQEIFLNDYLPDSTSSETEYSINNLQGSGEFTHISAGRNTPGIDDFVNLSIDKNTSPDQYKISWQALSNHSTYSRRSGNIDINSNGVLRSLTVNVPQQLKGFSCVAHTKTDEPSTLIIKRLDKAALEHIKSTVCFSSS